MGRTLLATFGQDVDTMPVHDKITKDPRRSVRSSRGSVHAFTVGGAEGLYPVQHPAGETAWCSLSLEDTIGNQEPDF